MKEILLAVYPRETRLAVCEDGKLTDFAAECSESESLVGRIYKGVVKNVVPTVKGRFLDIGIGQNVFLRDADALATGKRFPTEGAACLVQILKDGTDTKGPLVTMKISFPSRLVVLLAESDYIGVSRKIREDTERARLRETVKKIVPKGLGVILRTAAAEAAPDALEAELSRLVALWETVQKRARVQKTPGLIWRDGNLAIRALREYLTDDIDAIVTNDEETAALLTSLLQEEGRAGISVRREKGNLFHAHGIEDDAALLFSREVPLPSGGSLVIEHTEALTAIDVNSGGFRRAGISHEEAAYLVNLEAAAEIARQIRMRGIGGMILVDFIDMETDAQKDAVVSALRKAVANDRVKTVVLGMTQLGLVEMTRKRTGRRLIDRYTEICAGCGGSGRVLSVPSVVLAIHRALAHEKGKGSWPVCIECHPDVAKMLSAPEEMFLLKSISWRPVRVRENETMRRDVFSLLRDSEME